MRILLLFPPYADATHPYSSLPYLTAFLKQGDYTNVTQRDLNVEVCEILLSSKWLSKAHQELVISFEAIERETVLNPAEQTKYLRLAHALLLADYVIENIEEAKRIQRDKHDFYDVRRYAWSRKILENAFEIASAAYYPSRLLRSDYVMRYSTESSQQILQAAHDPKENLFLGIFRERVIPFILQQQPDLIGVSVTYPSQIIPAFTLAALIKEQAHHIHITFGGSMISNLSESLMHARELFEVVDTFVIYEGEHALLELCRRIESDGMLRDVPNLIYQEDGEVRISPKTFVEDLNVLPCPTYEGLPLHLYLSPEPVLMLSTSRGCYWNRCAFCTVSGPFRRGGYRQRRTQLLLRDIQHLSRQYGTSHFYFADDAANPELLESLSRLLLENNVSIYWQCEVRFEKSLTTQLCRVIQKAGCRNLIFGLESGCQRVLDLMQKGTNIDEARAILHRCRSAGIAVNIQFFTGFPQESLRESKQTLDFIIANQHLITTVSCGPFLLQKGSLAERFPKTYGITKIHRDDKLDLQRAFPYEVKKGITMQGSQRAICLIRERLRKRFAHSELSFGITAHTLLYLSHHGLDFFDVQEVESKTQSERQISLVSIPCVNDATLVRTFRYNMGRIEQILQDSVSSQTVQPEETTVLFNANTDRTLQISADGLLLLSLCNGQMTVNDIVSTFPNTSRSAIIQFLKRLQNSGMIDFCVGL